MRERAPSAATAVPADPPARAPAGGGVHPSWVGFFHLGVLYVVWSTTYLAIALAVRPGSGFPPWTMGGTRLLCAGAILLGMAALRRQRVWPRRGEWLPLLAGGLLLWTGGNGLVVWAERHAPSGLAAVFVGTTPIWAALIEALLDRRLPSGRLLRSLLVGFAGVAVLGLGGPGGGGHAGALATGALALAPLSWALGTVLQRRRPASLSPLAGSAHLQLVGAVGFLALAAATGEPPPRPDAVALAAWAYLVVVAGVLAFTSYVAATRLLPVTVVTTYAYVNPVLALYLGHRLLGEPVGPRGIAATLLVLLGVAGVLRERVGRGPA